MGPPSDRAVVFSLAHPRGTILMVSQELAGGVDLHSNSDCGHTRVRAVGALIAIPLMSPSATVANNAPAMACPDGIVPCRVAPAGAPCLPGQTHRIGQ